MSKKIEMPKAFTERLAFTALSDKEKEEIRERALQQVMKERKAREEEAFFQAALDKARLDTDTDMEPTQRAKLQREEVFVDLPGHAVHIMLDGVEYLHGFTYNVDSLQAQTMREIIQRAWNHEEEVGGANRHWYQKPRNTRLTRHSQRLTTTQILGV
jgi:hypothetical protein